MPSQLSKEDLSNFLAYRDQLKKEAILSNLLTPSGFNFTALEGSDPSFNGLDRSPRMTLDESAIANIEQSPIEFGDLKTLRQRNDLEALSGLLKRAGYL